jgi:hypothetical protein
MELKLAIATSNSNLQLNIQHIKFIDEYVFNESILKRAFSDIERKYKISLSEDNRIVIELALKDYFKSRYSKIGNTGMPSVLVDELWHVFILYTPIYFDFCKKQGVDYIHHSPEDVSKADSIKENNEMEFQSKRKMSCLNAYISCCNLEGLNPLETSSMPLLFNIDMLFDFEEGHYHDLEEIKKELLIYYN